MTKRARNAITDLRGFGRLAIEATRGVTEVVEAMQTTIGGGPARLFTWPVYAQIRGVTGLVGVSLDFALSQLVPLVGETLPGFEREAILAVLNGVLGDYLQENRNPLAIEMAFRYGGQPLELEPRSLRANLPQLGPRLLVYVHGSCANDLMMRRKGHDHGAALERDLGYTSIYLHYNSGLHISTNGRAFSALLERLIQAWPVPLEDFALLGYSMGGLVARSAIHFGETSGHRWRRQLRSLICLGTPHHGAPMERGGNLVDRLLGAHRFSAPLARLGKIRSAGITDMRHGNVIDEHWQGLDRFSVSHDVRSELRLPENVSSYAIAATRTPKSCGRLSSDGMVPVDSALGRHLKPELTLAFPKSHQWIGFGMTHLDLLNRPEVYEAIRQWLTASGDARRSSR